MIIINRVEYDTFNEDGEELHTKREYEQIFKTVYCDFFQILQYQRGVKLRENSTYDKRGFTLNKNHPYIEDVGGYGVNYYTFKEVYDALLSTCRSQRNDAGYSFINDYDNYVLEIINHPLLEKYRNEYHPKNKSDIKHKNKNERIFLYHFMKDFGRFPNEEEEVEYQKSFTEKEVEKMVEVYQKSLKKVRGAEKWKL